MRIFSIVFLLINFKIGTAQTEFFLDANDGTKLHVREYGKGEPIILLAGGPGMNPGYMKGIWDRLSVNYRCLVLDQRGTGRSILKNVDSASLTMENYMNDLEILRKYLKVDQLVVVGHSWGGMLAMEYCSKYPGRVKKLVLLDPGGPTIKFLAYFNDNIMMRLHDEDLKELKELESAGKPSLQAIMPGYFFDRKKGLEFKKVLDPDSIFGQPGISPYTFGSYNLAEKNRIASLPNYRGPAYLIQGRQDPVGESTVYEIQKYLPQIQIHFIEKCGHLPWVESDEAANEFFSLMSQVLK